MYFLIGSGDGTAFTPHQMVLYTMPASADAGGDLYLAALHSQQVASDIRPDALLRFFDPLPRSAALCAFALAFAIKVRCSRCNTWLPDAHTEAPTGVRCAAAVLLKLGVRLPAFALRSFRLAARAMPCSPRRGHRHCVRALVCMVHPI